MMKWITVAVLLLGVSAHASKPKDLSLSQKAHLLGQAYELNKNESTFDAQQTQLLIGAVLLGQQYELRTSIVSSACYTISKQYYACQFTFGVDSMADEDDGWGSLFLLELQVDAKTNKVQRTELQLVGS